MKMVVDGLAGCQSMAPTGHLLSFRAKHPHCVATENVFYRCHFIFRTKGQVNFSKRGQAPAAKRLSIVTLAETMPECEFGFTP